MNTANILIVGAGGQLGTALRAHYPDAQFADSRTLDITNADALEAYDWGTTEVIINAAGYTNVDGAETPEGRVATWKVNASGAQNLAHVAWKHQMTLVHVSTEYVFDGTHDIHTEDEPLSPLGSYAASKAAGDLLVSQLEKHYILRTSWVIGEGKNFVGTMLELAKKGINPTVVADQVGRLTFTSELVRAIDHLLTTQAAFGTYNVTNSGDSVSWADVARATYKEAGLPNTVTDITTKAYYEGKEGIAPRPLQSTLSLEKIEATGFESRDWRQDLTQYVNDLQA